jgi:hypothetical protein
MTRPLPDPLPDVAFERSVRTTPGGAWLDRVPGLLDQVAERWQLRVGDALADASASLTLRALRTDGKPVVLNSGWPAAVNGERASAKREEEVVVALAGRERPHWGTIPFPGGPSRRRRSTFVLPVRTHARTRARG